MRERFDPQELPYPTAVHTPTGRVFGDENTDVVVKQGIVEIRDTNGITVSFDARHSVLIPGRIRTYRYEVETRKSFLRSLLDKLKS